LTSGLIKDRKMALLKKKCRKFFVYFKKKINFVRKLKKEWY